MSRGLSRQQVGILLAMRQREQKCEHDGSCASRFWLPGQTLNCGSTPANIVKILYPEEWPTHWRYGRDQSLWRAVQSLRQRGLVFRQEGFRREGRGWTYVHTTLWHHHASDRELAAGQPFRALEGVKC